MQADVSVGRCMSAGRCVSAGSCECGQVCQGREQQAFLETESELGARGSLGDSDQQSGLGTCRPQAAHRWRCPPHVVRTSHRSPPAPGGCRPGPTAQLGNVAMRTVTARLQRGSCQPLGAQHLSREAWAPAGKPGPPAPPLTDTSVSLLKLSHQIPPLQPRLSQPCRPRHR